MVRAERRSAADADGSEPRYRARVHRQDEGREVRLVIDLDVLLAELGLGKTLLPERSGERGAGGNHILCDDRVAGLDGERLAQLRCVRARRLEPGSSTDAKRYCAPGSAERMTRSVSPLPSVRGSTAAS